MKAAPLRKHAEAASFTLLEILVAVTLFVLIILFATQIISSTSRTTLGNIRRLDAAAQARQTLDIFGLDWNARVSRPDVAVRILKQPGNDEISFLSQMPAPAHARQVTVVGYRVNAATPEARDNYRLERAALGFDWAGGNAIPLPLAAVPTLAEADYQPLTPGVFRFEACVLVPASKGAAPVLVANPSPNPVTTTTNLTAVLVAVAAIDSPSRLQIDPTRLKALVDALPDPTDASPDPCSLWQAALDRPGLAESLGIPATAAQSVRIAERYFYVNFAP
ncbi:MAG TPA: hypothetical protein VIM58_02975 [Candidatus Methylacidiphilales bacterium]